MYFFFYDGLSFRLSELQKTERRNPTKASTNKYCFACIVLAMHIERKRGNKERVKVQHLSVHKIEASYCDGEAQVGNHQPPELPVVTSITLSTVP